MTLPRRPTPRTVLAMTAVAVLALTGCAGPAATEVVEATDRPLNEVTLEVDDEIAALVPSEVRETGTLVIGTSPPYAPNQFTGPGGELVGFDIDVISAASQLMGLETSFQPMEFESLLPAVAGGQLDTAASSVTVNDERLETVDFVTYFEAGIQWATPAGTLIDPDDACGLSVAVKRTTLSDLRELPARSEACTSAGRPAIEAVRFDSQDDATAAVALGRVDAMSTDSPVAAFSVRQSQGKLQLSGDVDDAAPYGWPVRRDSDLAPALEAAAVKLIDTGVLETFARHWSVEDGLIDTPETRQGQTEDE